MKYPVSEPSSVIISGRLGHVVQNVATCLAKLSMTDSPKGGAAGMEGLQCNFSLSLFFITHIPLLYSPLLPIVLTYGLKSILLILSYLVLSRPP